MNLDTRWNLLDQVKTPTKLKVPVFEREAQFSIIRQIRVHSSIDLVIF